METINKKSMYAGKVLIVDDAPVNLDIAKGLLTPYGLQIDTAQSGEEAIEKINALEIIYDLIFMDHMMPMMDGIRAVKIIRNNLNIEYVKNVPIIALTANVANSAEKMFLDNGFDGFLSKPIDAEKLDETLAKHIRCNCKEVKEPNAHKIETTNNIGEKIAEFMESSDIKEIDFKAGIKRFGDNPVTFLQIIKSFTKNIPNSIAKVPLNIDLQNIADYAITIHGIKGSCYGISANILGDKAAALEKAGKLGDLEYVKIEHIHFEKQIALFVESLETFTAKIDAMISENDNRETKISPDKELLRKLLTASENFDLEEIQQTIDDLSKFKYENYCEEVEQLKVNAAEFSYDGIIEIIKSILAE